MVARGYVYNQFVFCGHDHHYERSKPIGSKGNKHAVTYIVGGNGGTPMRYIGKQRDYSLFTGRTFGFALVDVNGSKIKFREISIDNKVIDEFELDKNSPESVAKYLSNEIYFENIKDPSKKVRKLYRSVGRKAYKKKKYSEAIPALKEAFNLDQTCGEAAGLLSVCYAKIGDFKNAEKYANKAIKVTPLLPDSYKAMATVYLNKKEYKKAIEWYKKQFTVQPDSPGALEDIANIYIKQKEYEEAVKTYKKAAEVLPNDWEVHFNFAQLYEKISKKSEALSEYQKAVKWFYDEKENNDHILAVEKVKELSD